jgi:hypothetical protein
MKRTLKKLTLSRETIAKLSQDSLGMVAGASGATCPAVATCDATCLTMCFVCPSQANCSRADTNCLTC